MSIRRRFVRKFGEEQTKALENAANQHYIEGATISGENKGSDSFKWAIITVIDLECIGIESFRVHHGITISYRGFLRFCFKNRKDLGKHDGDMGWLGLFSGVYGFLTSKEEYKKMRKTVLSREEHQKRGKDAMKKMKEQMKKMRTCMTCGSFGVANQSICEKCGSDLNGE